MKYSVILIISLVVCYFFIVQLNSNDAHKKANIENEVSNRNTKEAIEFPSYSHKPFENQSEVFAQNEKLVNEVIETTPNNSAEAVAKKEIQQKFDSSQKQIADYFDYGVNQPVALSENAHTQSLQLALQNPKAYPERLSVLHQAKPFDRVSYENDPASYLSVIEPSRVFQQAQPLPETQRIQRVSKKMPVVAQGQSIVLQVKAEAHMPVTFTSFDLGRFENQLTTITVKADAEGLAQTKFMGSEGTIGTVNVLAACPTTSGQVKFIINVTQAE